MEKPKTFELMNVIFDLDAEDLGKREIKVGQGFSRERWAGWERVKWEKTDV